MKYLVVICLLISCVAVQQSASNTDSHKQWWYDGVGEQRVEHAYFALDYSEEHEQASYVTYILTREMLEGEKVRRTDNFREDPKIQTGSASLADYKGSGYDRGHLCPAGDMAFSPIAMSESFYLSNMSPQAPSFNRGVWKKLEEQVREWAEKYDSLIIYTGPILDSVVESIGPNKVSVPYRYFKTVYSVKEKQAIAFILPNEKSADNITSFQVSIDSLELVIDRDLYRGLPIEEQESFESGKSHLLLN